MANDQSVLVLSTGGTILTSGSGGGVVDANANHLLRELGVEGSIITRELLAKPGSHLTVAEMLSIAAAAEEATRDGYAVVIVHGTDTLEETAYLTSMVISTPSSIVVTGAMRRRDDAGADGPANLLAAIEVARSGAVAGIGPVVVLNDEIHSARWARKGHTSKPSTFTSAPAGPLGEIVEGRVELWMVPRGRDYVGPCATADSVVPVVHIVPGLDERGLPDANRLDGVVVAGTGGGHVPPTVLPWLDRLLDAGKPVVLASRVPEGRILHDTYGGPGSERDLIERGCLPAGYLSAEKARLRLLVALGAGVRPDDAFPGRAGPVAMLGSTSRKAAT